MPKWNFGVLPDVLRAGEVDYWRELAGILPILQQLPEISLISIRYNPMDSDAFLTQEIATSSPARLRFLLIQKAVGLCSFVESQWKAKQYDHVSQWMLRIQEILTELLEGVQANNNPLAATISDLYIYLLELALSCQQSKDIEALSALREILEIEQETWSLFVNQESRASHATSMQFASDEQNHSDAVGFDLQI